MRSIFYTALFSLLIVACAGKSGSKGQADLEKLPREQIDEDGIAFSVAQIPGLFRVHRDSVPWAAWLPRTEQNAQIGYYFLEKEEVDLQAAHIRLEYVAKNMPWCSSTDSLFIWLKQTFINTDRNGRVLIEGEELETMDGQSAPIMAIRVPEVATSDTSSLSAKTMAWGYVDHGNFWIGLTFSSVDTVKYETGMPLFRDLIRSYREK